MKSSACCFICKFVYTCNTWTWRHNGDVDGLSWVWLSAVLNLPTLLPQGRFRDLKIGAAWSWITSSHPEPPSCLRLIRRGKILDEAVTSSGWYATHNTLLWIVLSLMLHLCSMSADFLLLIGSLFIVVCLVTAVFVCVHLQHFYHCSPLSIYFYSLCRGQATTAVATWTYSSYPGRGPATLRPNKFVVCCRMSGQQLKIDHFFPPILLLLLLRFGNLRYNLWTEACRRVSCVRPSLLLVPLRALVLQTGPNRRVFAKRLSNIMPLYIFTKGRRSDRHSLMSIGRQETAYTAFIVSFLGKRECGGCRECCCTRVVLGWQRTETSPGLVFFKPTLCSFLEI
jgi:hypothetical protein